MGRTERRNNIPPIFTIVKKEGRNVWIEDGAISQDGKVRGTYIHGLFDNDEFRRGLINHLRKRKGLGLLRRRDILPYGQVKEEGFNNLERGLRENLDMDFIYRILNVMPKT